MKRLASLIDRIVTAIEGRVNWRPLWASRLLGCTIGLARIVEWAMPLYSFQRGRVLHDRIGMAWAMWRARYWYDWRTA